jgi:UDPglucose--hexose-1-phosphate uridylyltransferase
MSQNQIRQNKATKEWVIFATDRGDRPKDFSKKEKQKKQPEYDKECPFCTGNESKLPNIIMEMPGKDGKWQTRVVPNKYPALFPDGDPFREAEDIYVKMNSYGRHEVIIESPYHNRDISQMSSDEIHRVIETYHKRYLDVMRTNKNMVPLIFRNHGEHAGTSLLHPHSQLIVTGFVPHHIRWREIEAQRYHDEWGKCVFCEMLKYELKKEVRIVMEENTMAAFVPYAADVPFEVWIMPRQHKADFGKISDEEKTDLVVILQSILSKYYEKLNDPDYNYIINTSARYEAGEPHLHWYLQIRPRLTTRAGFEIGSGISINPSIPEEDAEFLRKD